jgi:predicted RecB family nuclease
MAREQNDVALIPGIDQGAAQALINDGVTTIDELLSRHDAEILSNLKKPRGKSMVRIGKVAGRILLEAEALRDKKEMQITPVELPEADNFVMFDLEGLPPQFDELDKVYLWGMQVYGRNPSEFMPALAGFGIDGDREGWEQFLIYAKNIFNKYGDIPFVHWASYEKTKISAYISRYGDRDGIAQRVLDDCVDLLPVTKKALVLPVHSYGLKTIEQYAGFKRTMAEFGGDWSIVQYIRAVETEDQDLRQNIMNDILKYNREDLQATWAVVQWEKAKK